MGATLVKQVLGPEWSHLPGKARCLLAFMAITALDDDKPPRYFGGRNALVSHLYGVVDLDPRRRRNQYREVNTQLQVLKQAGAIELINKGIHTGERAEYELRVDGGIPRPVDAPAAAMSGRVDGDIPRPTGRGKSAQLDGDYPRPKEKEENEQEDVSIQSVSGSESESSLQTHSRPRARAEAEDSEKNHEKQKRRARRPSKPAPVSVGDTLAAMARTAAAPTPQLAKPKAAEVERRCKTCHVYESNHHRVNGHPFVALTQADLVHAS
jgi:hypothetical protein